MSDKEIMRQLIDDACEWGLDWELSDFINNNPNLTVTEIDEQFRNEWDI